MESIQNSFYSKKTAIFPGHPAFGDAYHKTGISYRDIVWISEQHNQPGFQLACVKYYNHHKLRDQYVFMAADFRFNEYQPSSDSEIACYIREQIKRVQPEYNIDHEPSHWMITLPLFAISAMVYFLAV